MNKELLCFQNIIHIVNAIQKKNSFNVSMNFVYILKTLSIQQS